MKRITINGIEYDLVPVEKPPVVAKRLTVPEKDDVLDGYRLEEPPVKPGEVKKAVGGVSEYREKFKNRTLTLADLPRTPRRFLEFVPQDKQLDSFTYKGEKLFFGKGIEQEII